MQYSIVVYGKAVRLITNAANKSLVMEATGSIVILIGPLPLSPLGHRQERYLGTKFGQDLDGRIELSLPTVNHDEIRQGPNILLMTVG